MGFMEYNDTSNSINHFNDDGNENGFVQQILRSDSSSERKELFWYDIRNFPDALLIEILARLPVKSIFTFKSVCKHWQTLISHPSFCRFHHSIQNSNVASSSRPFRILQRYTHVPNFKELVNRLGTKIHNSSESSVLFLSSPEEQYRYDQFRFLAMNNGLILCRSWSSTPFVYYICDPLTRQWITIPRHEPRFNNFVGEGLITRFNEDHILTGYTVVRAERLPSLSDYLNLEMFSSETDKWIDYNLPCDIPIKLLDGNGPILCYGALHWPISFDDFDHGMVAFDLYKDPKSVRLIQLPEDRDIQSEYEGGIFQLCGESEGTLRYFEVARDPTLFYVFTMWAMKDYEKGEWCCEFKVRRSDIHSNDVTMSNWLLDDGWFFPFSFHPLDQNVVYLTCMDPQYIVAYDVLNRRLDVVCKPIDIVRYIPGGCVVPLVLPRWPVLGSIATVKTNL